MLCYINKHTLTHSEPGRCAAKLIKECCWTVVSKKRTLAGINVFCSQLSATKTCEEIHRLMVTALSNSFSPDDFPLAECVQPSVCYHCLVPAQICQHAAAMVQVQIQKISVRTYVSVFVCAFVELCVCGCGCGCGCRCRCRCRCRCVCVCVGVCIGVRVCGGMRVFVEVFVEMCVCNLGGVCVCHPAF